MSTSEGEVTRLIARWSQGDEDAFDRVVEMVYDDLRRIAHRQLRRGHPHHTLDTTGLVHEAYLKLADAQDPTSKDRNQFFAFFSKVMRRILIDYARARAAEKRGGSRIRVPLEEDTATVDAQVFEILAVDEALEFLTQRDPRLTHVVECRFFGGLSVSETADALDLSTRTVQRDWVRARAILARALAANDPSSESGAGDGAGDRAEEM